LPSIVNEFLRQAKDAKLFNAFKESVLNDAIESDLSRTFGGIGRLDMFFPFDPYLLKESDRLTPLILLLLEPIYYCSFTCLCYVDYNYVYYSKALFLLDR
jgi:hypothetical protein